MNVGLEGWFTLLDGPTVLTKQDGRQPPRMQERDTGQSREETCPGMDPTLTKRIKTDIQPSLTVVQDCSLARYAWEAIDQMLELSIFMPCLQAINILAIVTVQTNKTTSSQPSKKLESHVS